MRLLDRRTDRPLGFVSVFLTRDEATELSDFLAQALDEGWKDPRDHFHVSDEDRLRDGPDVTREITVAVYTPGSTDGCGERVARLILEDR